MPQERSANDFDRQHVMFRIHSNRESSERNAPLLYFHDIAFEDRARKVAHVDCVDSAEIAEVVFSLQLLQRETHALDVVPTTEEVVAIHTTYTWGPKRGGTTTREASAEITRHGTPTGDADVGGKDLVEHGGVVELLQRLGGNGIRRVVNHGRVVLVDKLRASAEIGTKVKGNDLVEGADAYIGSSASLVVAFCNVVDEVHSLQSGEERRLDGVVAQDSLDELRAVVLGKATHGRAVVEHLVPYDFPQQANPKGNVPPSVLCNVKHAQFLRFLVGIIYG